MKRLLIICMVMIALVMLASQAFASMYTDTYGSTVTFAVNGDILTVTLADGRTATQGGQELTAVFFNVDTGVTLTPISAILPTGSTVWGADGSTVALPLGNNVGGEWAYLTGINAFGANSGISSTGLNIFGNANFNGPNLAGTVAVDGGNYALTKGTTGFAGNNAPLVNYSTVFTLTGASNFKPNQVTGVTWLYGTSLNDGEHTTPTPIPAAVWLFGSGLMGLVGIRRRFLK